MNEPTPPPSRAEFALCIVASIIGMAAVHALGYQTALQDKAAHLSPAGAHWQAVFNDFLVGIPVSAATGWAVAITLKRRRKPIATADAQDANSP